ANGETFSGLLGKAGVPQSIANELIENAKKVFNVRDLRAGAHYHLYNVDDSCGGYPAWLVYDKSQREAVVFSLRDSLYAYIDEKDVATELKYAEVTIENSLWYDTQKAGCPALLAARLSDIYAWTIDFFGLQKGDSYQVLYESVECDGKVVDVGRVVYASFVHSGKEYKSFWYDGQEGGTHYWNEKGESLRKAFLKAPLKFSRVSSGFSYARRHPVTRRVQPHTGVDYAAPKGTPVVSIGDGVVTSAKYEGAGGNTVRIKHNSTYRTAYLHLSKYGKGIRAGAHVSQGQVIGYVGSTGRSTGPHLDFRVWKNNTPINPLKMESPNTDPIPSGKMEDFENAKFAALAQRDSIQAIGYYNALLDIL
ncbi:MAG: peptidoglycan DD-metalloendopeptidase family protein, partial [Bacteroidales bacterium]|nr:peptidoglycan DD-metalloendopeptidase family protein [Bacteroidales bacterium]